MIIAKLKTLMEFNPLTNVKKDETICNSPNI